MRVESMCIESQVTDGIANFTASHSSAYGVSFSSVMQHARALLVAMYYCTCIVPNVAYLKIPIPIACMTIGAKISM